MKCVACPFLIRNTELVVCVLCKHSYHYKCVNISDFEYAEKMVYLKREWQCPSCTNITSRRRGTDTPVRRLNQTGSQASGSQAPEELYQTEARNEHLSESQQTNMSCDASLLDLDSESCTTGNRSVIQPREDTEESSISYNAFAVLLELKFTQLRSELNKQSDSLRSEFNRSTNSLMAEIKGLKHNIGIVTEKIKSLETENAALKSQLAECKSSQSPDTQILRDTICRLEIELNEKDQATLTNDLEISGVPEFKEESPVHIVMALATKIGVGLQECDVVYADRAGPVRETARAGAPDAAPPRPRPLVVRLARRALRDALLKGARVRRGATTEGIGLPDHAASKFHIHDRLTKKNRALFGKAREKTRLEQWRFIWSREGRIYVRKSESSKVLRIHTESDLDRIFSMAPPTDCNV